MIQLLVAIAPAMAQHHIDGDLASAPGGRQNDAALASHPTSFLCHCSKIKKFTFWCSSNKRNDAAPCGSGHTLHNLDGDPVQSPGRQMMRLRLRLWFLFLAVFTVKKLTFRCGSCKKNYAAPCGSCPGPGPTPFWWGSGSGSRGRKNDAASALPPTSFPSCYTMKIKNFNIFMLLRQEKWCGYLWVWLSPALHPPPEDLYTAPGGKMMRLRQRLRPLYLAEFTATKLNILMRLRLQQKKLCGSLWVWPGSSSASSWFRSITSSRKAKWCGSVYASDVFPLRNLQ
jgi:hypothetical protein